MSVDTMEAHYLPNWNLAQAHRLAAYNCGYTERRGAGPFADYQKALVWQLLGDAAIAAATVVLDVGSGIGGPAGWIWERFGPGQLYGVEYCASSVCAARDLWKDAERHPEFLQGDAHCLPLADGSVDLVFNLESALHYADKDRFLVECARVLKPGGRLCLGDITTEKKWMFAPAAWLNKLKTQFNSNVRLWSRDDYQRGLAAAGLKLTRHHDATSHVADSLADGIDEVSRRGWSSMRGFRGRFLYLVFLEKLLRSGKLHYDLYNAVR